MQNYDYEAEDEDAYYVTMFKYDSDSNDKYKKENRANKILFFDFAAKMKSIINPNIEISSFLFIIFLGGERI